MRNAIVFTGSAGPGSSTAAAATALHYATTRQRTLLLSTSLAAGLTALFGTQVGSAPTTVAPNLDAATLDAPALLASAWERGRSQMPSGLAQVAGDELPLLPGADLLLGLLHMRNLAAPYTTIVLDAGAHEPLLRALAAPDALRWAVRLLFGLDRGSGRSSASLGRALLPTTFIPNDAYAGVQDARVRAEQLRDELLLNSNTTVRYVLRPDQAALDEARIAIPALQLHGLAVAAVLVGPLLPEEADSPALSALAAQHKQIVASATTTWHGRTVRTFPLHADATARDALVAIGAQVAANPSAQAPIASTWQGAPAVAIELPGLPKGALQLTLSSDELIVRVGPYRRHVLLPDALRGTSNIRATREGEYLVVRQR